MKHQDDVQNQVKIQPEHKRRHAALPQALVRMYTLILPILLLIFHETSVYLHTHTHRHILI